MLKTCFRCGIDRAVACAKARAPNCSALGIALSPRLRLTSSTTKRAAAKVGGRPYSAQDSAAGAVLMISSTDGMRPCVSRLTTGRPDRLQGKFLHLLAARKFSSRSSRATFADRSTTELNGLIMSDGSLATNRHDFL